MSVQNVAATTAVVKAGEQSNKLTVDVSRLPAGIYILTVNTDLKTHTRKIVKL
ncbi:MAG: T9SS type A sorting domain-containing protein [Bacteroides sp.]|nr:T9SS type A sorting domain-containing protein [Bacteroides sp.]MCM1379316.1 T9SS type A sorting domain-containing protein [Bacteroides sp.]MCM1445025.1 T9SS type A sorting domain-containing protein [Prevotella sp.]